MRHTRKGPRQRRTLHLPTEHLAEFRRCWTLPFPGRRPLWSGHSNFPVRPQYIRFSARYKKPDAGIRTRTDWSTSRMLVYASKYTRDALFTTSRPLTVISVSSERPRPTRYNISASVRAGLGFSPNIRKQVERGFRRKKATESYLLGWVPRLGG